MDNVVTGENNVTVTAGNSTLELDPIKDKFYVPKLDTKLSLDSVNDTLYGDKVTVSGKLLDENGKPVKGAKIIVNVDGVNKTVTTDENGKYNATFPTTTMGTKLVTVEYAGDKDHNKASNDDTFEVYKDSGIITVNLPDNAKAGQTTNITGKVTDENGKPIANLPVNVTVNGKTYKVTTQPDGTFTIPVKNVVTGENNVTVKAGNKTVEIEPVNDKFYVPKQDTTLTINPIKDTLSGNNVTVSGKLVDEDGKAVKGANVTVTVDGKNQTVTTDSSGKYKATFPTSTEGTKLVTVDYAGDKDHNKASKSDTFDVYKESGNITVNLPKDPVAGEPVNITGSVTNDKGKPIANIPVNITVNGKTYETKTDKNGKFSVPVDNIVSGKNNITVTGGNSTVELIPDKESFEARKQKDVITIVDPADTPVGKPLSVSGQLLDEHGNPIPNAEVTVFFNGIKKTVKTNSKGKYNVTFPTDEVGKKDVKVEYAGNEIYNSTKENTKVNIVPNNGTITLELPKDAAVAKTTTINGTLRDQDGKLVPNTPVNVTVNGKVYTTKTDKNGRFTISVNNVVAGKNNVTATGGNANITVKPVKGTFNARKQNATLTIDPIKDTKIGENVSITGRMTNEDGKPVKNANVGIRINGQAYYVRTDSNGNYELTVPANKTGLNNVSVSYSSCNYNPTKATTTFNVNKLKVTVKVNAIKGTVGENITLVAKVTDENGNPVTDGTLVFKLNGRSLRVDNRFDTSNASIKKFNVKNGTVTFTMKADKYLLGAVNITASYSGSGKYESKDGNVAKASINKRTATIKVSVSPSTTKQNKNITFTITLADITKNATNKTCLTTNASIILKVNGVTLKNADGSVMRIPVTSSVMKYVYYIPSGMAGVDDEGNVRNYTVEAVYDNDLFVSNVRNTSVFHVERSPVNINFKSTTVKNNVLSIKATFTDYQNNNLVGTNKICVKINGETYKVNGTTKYFNIKDGVVDLTGIKIKSGTTVESVTLVTGDRQAYESARVTTTKIKVL